MKNEICHEVKGSSKVQTVRLLFEDKELLHVEQGS